MPWYRTGTAALINSSTTVNGTGTSWLTAAASGEAFLGPDGRIYEITSVLSNTQMTITPAYLGSTASAQGYTIAPTQSYLRDLASQVTTLVSDYATVRDGAATGRFPDGTQAAPGVRFSLDDDTGLRRPAANTVAVVLGGADRLTISASGVTGITKADVGLGSVANTTDAAKPVSTAQQTALNLKADLSSPALTGTPTAPTAVAGVNTTQLATTAHVFAERANTVTLANKTLTSPVLTGTPTAPTADAATNTTQVATTAHVFAERAAVATLTNKTLTSPSLTGTPIAPTAAAGVNTTQVATTAHVFAERANTADLTNKTLTAPKLTTEAVDVITNSLPTIRPSLSLDFANSKSVDPRITFTRASAATRYNERGLLEIVASNVPRIDFDPVTGECKGLLIEEARTNFIVSSERFSNSSWTKVRLSAQPANEIAPDGSLTAEVFTVTQSSDPYATRAVTTNQGVTYSVFAKKGGANPSSRVALRPITFGTGTTNDDPLYFNFDTKTFSVGAALLNIGFEELSNGWFRLFAHKAPTAGQTAIEMRISPTDSAAVLGATALFWGAQLEAGSFPTSYVPSTETFTGRASSGTFIGSDGLIQTAAAGVARLGHNPANLTVAPKLMLEAAATNLITFSEEFNNAAWGKVGVGTAIAPVVTANHGIAPDGTMTADRVVFDKGAGTTSNDRSDLSVAGTGITVAGQPTCATIFIRSNTSATYLMRLDFNGANSQAEYPSTISVTPEWKRHEIRLSNPFDTDRKLVIRLRGTTGTSDFADVLIWGAQQENSVAATSYIATTTAAATRAADTATSAQSTRAADNASMTGLNLSSWYRQDEGSFVAGFRWPLASAVAAGTFPRVLSLNTGSVGNRIGVVLVPSTRFASLFVAENNVTQADTRPATAISLADLGQVAVAYAVNNFAISVNGTGAVSDAVGTLPLIDRFNLGNFNNSNHLNGHISRITYYPKRLTNAELVALSTP